ncbi:MAG: response regulator [Desulfobacterales bacterium]|nr:response regulator [Desulfobacterales bacterium]MCP4163525.1 response regulator [Deltaproteobacteria bacterium]
MSVRKKILVVDDTAYLRKIIKEELESGGYEVQVSEDGLKALTHLPKFQPDLVTLDIEMPKLNGFKTCEKLYNDHYAQHFEYLNYNKVPIVFVTSNDNFEDRKKGFDLGATDFITKPFMKGDLLNVVNNILFPDNILEDMTVLVVDDSKTSKAIVVNSLKRHGVNILEAENGREAYTIICKEMDHVDMVISDLEMPVMDGGELCRRIRNELGLKNLPFIFMSGADKSLLIDVFKAGGTDYLVKPFLKEELLARVTVQMEKAKLNKRMVEAVSELRDYNKMKDDLIAVCSHDLRSPLNNILGFSNHLLSDDSHKKEDVEALGYIKDSGEILLNLINDILDLTKFQSENNEIEMYPLSMYETVQISTNAFKNLTQEKNQIVSVVNNAEKTTVIGNGNCMIRVVNNLLSNAIKFTPENGKINLTVDNIDQNVILTIEDSGIGIPKESIPHLFDKFTKTSQRGTSGEAGTGLGMAIVKEIVEQHGGSIDLKSKVDEGTTFIIKFPAPKDLDMEIQKVADIDPSILI